MDVDNPDPDPLDQVQDDAILAPPIPETPTQQTTDLMIPSTPVPVPVAPSTQVPPSAPLPPVPPSPLVPPNPPLPPSPLVPPLSQQSTTQKRHRCYPESMKGPFEVFIRQKEKPINVLLISAEVHKNFRTIKEIKQVNFRKVRMVFSDRMEANNVVYNDLISKLYRIYIPSEKVEVDGVIHQADLDLNYLVQEGFGKFKDPRVPQVSILECQRLAEARVEGGVKTYSTSHSIRVTFEGLILPDYVELDRALIPVRVFAPKVMHCSKCNKFGHTQYYCSNKACCGKCGKQHNDESCPIHEQTCLHCKGTHESKDECPVYKIRKEMARTRVLQKSKMSYAELVKAPASQSFEHENPYASLSDISEVEDEQAHCSKSEPPKRKKIFSRHSTKRAKTVAQNTTSPADQFSREKTAADPPKFKKSDFPLVEPTSDVPGFRKVDSPPINGNDLMNQNRVPNEDSNVHQGEEKFTIKQLIQLFAELFNMDKCWIDILVKLTPLLKTVLAKITSKLPLLASFLSLDG